MRSFRLSEKLKQEADEVREDRETLTDQIEDGLRRHIRARKRKLRQRSQE